MVHSSKKKIEEQNATVANGCDILIATPSRLKEMLEQTTVDVSQVRHVILDEVDSMLDDETKEDIKFALKELFSTGKKQSW